MKRLMMIMIAALVAGIGAAIPAQARDKGLVPGRTAYVDVAVATLWTAPDILRPVDAPSAANPVNMRKWTGDMTYEQQLELSGDGMLETQALYGNKVTILDRDGNWVKVAVDGQPTPRNDLGYPGWMPVSQLVFNKHYAQATHGPFVMVTDPTAFIYKNASLKKKGIEISYNTRLPYISETPKAYKVSTPDGGHAWIAKQAGRVYRSQADIPVPTGKDLVETGKKFFGLHYLWAGMSGFGFDCSGFTFTLYQSHGITIPRDSSVQAKHGQPVPLDELEPGDLLFFAHDHGKGRVHHVAMYAGDGMMIHSPNSKRDVEIIPVNTPGYIEELAGARRYLPGHM